MNWFRIAVQLAWKFSVFFLFLVADSEQGLKGYFSCKLFVIVIPGIDTAFISHFYKPITLVVIKPPESALSGFCHLLTICMEHMTLQCLFNFLLNYILM